MKTFAEVLQAEADKERQDGRAATRKRPRGGLTDFCHGTTGDVMLFNPFAVVIEDEYAICNPAHAPVRAYIDRVAATVQRIGQTAPIEVVWDRANRRIVAADDGCVLRAIRQCIEGGSEIRAVAARVSALGYSPLERMLRSLIPVPGMREATVLEKADQVRRICDLFGWTIPQIAERIHLKAEIVRQWVDQAQTLPEPIRRMVEEGAVSLTLAYQVLRDNGYAAGTAHAELLQAQALAGEGVIRPRMVAQIREGGAARPSLRTVLRDALHTSTIVHSPSVELVTVTMGLQQYEAIQERLRCGEGNDVDIKT